MTIGIAWLLVGAGSTTACAGGPSAHGLCHAPQTTYFQCDTDRHKTISLCGELPTTLRYGYGTAAHRELQFPASASGSAAQFGFAHYARYQTERSDVIFHHARTDYAVFDSTEKGRHRAGVDITIADGRQAQVRCVGAIQGQPIRLGESLHCDADSALNEAGCP